MLDNTTDNIILEGEELHYYRYLLHYFNYQNYQKYTSFYEIIYNEVFLIFADYSTHHQKKPLFLLKTAYLKIFPLDLLCHFFAVEIFAQLTAKTSTYILFDKKVDLKGDYSISMLEIVTNIRHQILTKNILFYILHLTDEVLKDELEIQKIIYRIIMNIHVKYPDQYYTIHLKTLNNLVTKNNFLHTKIKNLKGGADLKVSHKDSLNYIKLTILIFHVNFDDNFFSKFNLIYGASKILTRGEYSISVSPFSLICTNLIVQRHNKYPTTISSVFTHKLTALCTTKFYLSQELLKIVYDLILLEYQDLFTEVQNLLQTLFKDDITEKTLPTTDILRQQISDYLQKKKMYSVKRKKLEEKIQLSTTEVTNPDITIKDFAQLTAKFDDILKS
jgi:hypothetical protein